MKTLNFFFLFLFSFPSFAIVPAFYFEGKKVNPKDITLDVGDTLRVEATAVTEQGEPAQISFNCLWSNCSNSSYQRSKASVNVTVDADAAAEGRISIGVWAKDYDGIFADNASQADETIRFDLAVKKEKFIPDPSPAKIISYSVTKDGKSINESGWWETTLNVGDQLQVKATSVTSDGKKALVYIGTSFAENSTQGYQTSEANSTITITEESAVNGWISIYIWAKDYDGVPVNPNAKVDALKNLRFSVKKKAIALDSSPAKLGEVKVIIEKTSLESTAKLAGQTLNSGFGSAPQGKFEKTKINGVRDSRWGGFYFLPEPTNASPK